MRRYVSARPPARGPLAVLSASTDAVVVGQGTLKLGWVLYRDTNMSDEEAARRYRGQVDQRLTSLEFARQGAEERIGEAVRRLAKFDEAVQQKNLRALDNILVEDLREAIKERNQDLAALALAIPGAAAEHWAWGAASGVSWVPAVPRRVEQAAAVWDTTTAARDAVEFGARLGERVAKSQSLGVRDWEALADMVAGYASLNARMVAAPGAPTIAYPIGFFQIASKSYGAYLSDQRMWTLGEAVRQTVVPRENFRFLLQDRIAVEAMRSEYFTAQIAMLRGERRLLDPRSVR